MDMVLAFRQEIRIVSIAIEGGAIRIRGVYYMDVLVSVFGNLRIVQSHYFVSHASLELKTFFENIGSQFDGLVYEIYVMLAYQLVDA